MKPRILWTLAALSLSTMFAIPTGVAPPPGLGELDPYVDANGDSMFGDLAWLLGGGEIRVGESAEGPFLGLQALAGAPPSGSAALASQSAGATLGVYGDPPQGSQQLWSDKFYYLLGTPARDNVFGRGREGTLIHIEECTIGKRYPEQECESPVGQTNIRAGGASFGESSRSTKVTAGGIETAGAPGTTTRVAVCYVSPPAGPAPPIQDNTCFATCPLEVLPEGGCPEPLQVVAIVPTGISITDSEGAPGFSYTASAGTLDLASTIDPFLLFRAEPGRLILKNEATGATAEFSHDTLRVSDTNGYWIFTAGMTDVGFTLTVTDGATGTQRTYVTPRQVTVEDAATGEHTSVEPQGVRLADDAGTTAALFGRDAPGYFTLRLQAIDLAREVSVEPLGVRFDAHLLEADAADGRPLWDGQEICRVGGSSCGGTVNLVDTTLPLVGGPITSAGSVGLMACAAAGQVLKWSGSSWDCAADANSGGTITAVNTPAGGGLQGGGAGGDIDLLIRDCDDGQTLIFLFVEGNWVCATPPGGTVTTVNTGLGLTGGPITISGTIAIDPNAVALLNAANTYSVGPQTVQTGGAANRGLVIRGTAGQTANPLEVQGSAGDVTFSMDALGAITTTGVTVPVIYFGDGGAFPNRGVYGCGGGSICMSTGGAQRLVLDGPGNVGVGTAAPCCRLHVQGAAAQAGTGTLSSSATTVTGTGTSFQNELRVGDTVTAAGQTRSVVSIASQLQLTTDTAFDPALAGAAFSFQQPTAQLWNDGGATQLLVNSLGAVGIGTANPTQRLHVAGGMRGDALTLGGGSAASTALRVGGDWDSGTGFFAPSGQNTVRFAAGGSEIFSVGPGSTISNQNLVINGGGLQGTGANDALVVNSFLPGTDTAAPGTPAVRVGVGTNAPLNTGGNSVQVSSDVWPALVLHLLGSGQRWTDSVRNDDARIVRDETMGFEKVVIEKGLGPTTVTNGDLIVDNNLRVPNGNLVLDAGSLGIGTVPTERLDVAGTAQAQMVRATDFGTAALPTYKFFDPGLGIYNEELDVIHVSTASQERVRVDGFGNVGIGTTNPLDLLQVFGDIRVGTSGMNGCVKDFSGGSIAGTCSSDARLKRNVEPYGPTLDKVVALRPVHYEWRAEEFPAYGFGPGRQSGLVAQEVEAVLPDLVGVDARGHKTVDYAQLPLLLLQATKELEEHNDRLEQENEELRQRLDALEALVRGLVANGAVAEP